MNTTLKLLAGVAGVGMLAFGAGTAQADPSGAPAGNTRPLIGVGSDTTQGVMNALSNAVTVNGVKVISSWDATGASTITTTSALACKGLTRPNGSGAGRTALLAQIGTTNCFTFGRSSSLNQAAASTNLTYVPFAIDAVTYVVAPNSSIARDLSLTDLHGYYSCDPAYVGTGPNYLVHPLLPQAGSGTRSFWETTVGITEADVTAGHYPCISDTKNGKPIEEHDGRVLDANSIAPFSIAQYIAQGSGTIPDLRGSAVLGNINGTPSLLLNTGSAATREVYNEFATANVNVSPYSDVFVGPNSGICKQTAVIKTYGFGIDPNCGDTSKVTG